MLSGAASGIGRHMALALYRRGHLLTLLDLDEAGLTRLVQEEGLAADRVLARKLDVRDAGAWAELVNETVRRFGRLDFMFNIAGFLRPGNVHEVSPELLAQHMDVNAKGLMFACQAGARQMVQQRSGHIINVASIAGLSHVPGLAAYAASKHAARGFSLSLAHELRPHGVAVSVLCPDAVETPMLTLQETYAEAEMTFGAGRALTLSEVERAIERLMRTRELELVLDVPRTGRALGARLANMFPRLTQLAHAHIARRGRGVQSRRIAAKR
jgi:NAD(P)-dependent dehydrogenase (short-subunit alcohol dehydrogenase family)